MCGRTLNRTLWLVILCCTFQSTAEEPGEWLFDSLADVPGAASAGQQVDEVLLKMLDRWNAHNIEGYMEVYWKSPELLVVIGSEQFDGWLLVHSSYVKGDPGATGMGFIQPKRIQVRLIKPALAPTFTWWTINLPFPPEGGGG